eukprot:1045296-Prymnesium_polylepis.1
MDPQNIARTGAQMAGGTVRPDAANDSGAPQRRGHPLDRPRHAVRIPPHGRPRARQQHAAQQASPAGYTQCH